MATKPLVSDYLVPPGHYVREALEHYGMTQAELAERTGRPPQAISEIVNGKKELTEETAFELEAVLGTPAHVWLNLECTYRYGLESQQQTNRLAEQGETSKRYPYAELAKLGLVEATLAVEARVANLLRFFGVANLELVHKSYAAAFRKAEKQQPSPHCLAAWLRIGEKLAEDLELPAFDRVALQAALPALRTVTTIDGDVARAIQEVLSAAGVAFVLAPHLPKTYANGAAFWHAGRPVVLLSIRGVYEDIFWFTLFHELGHILLHERSATFIEGLGARSEEEEQANQFACDILIARPEWDRFKRSARIDETIIRAFADKQGICPAIVVGRLMHEDGAYARYRLLHPLRRKLVYDS